MMDYQTSWPDLLDNGTEMGRRIVEFDWSTTSLGAIENWPQSLRSIMSILVSSNSPRFLWWSDEYVQFYNDAFRPIMGSALHPSGLGQRGPECWGEAWEHVFPLVQAAKERGEPSYVENGELPLERDGYVEETYFDYAYTPVRDESGRVGGIFCAVTETTQRVLGARRVRALRDVGIHAVEAEGAEEVCHLASTTLARHPRDVPFALIYLTDVGDEHERGEGRMRRMRLCGASGLESAAVAVPELIDLTRPDPTPFHLHEVMRTGEPRLVEDLPPELGLPGGPWGEPASTAVVLPLGESERDTGFGVAVFGASPRRVVDDAYRGFFELLAKQLAAAVQRARAYELERRRAEALAELDRAKSVFYSNVSHEFRTPLTLMLGPVQDALADSEEPCPPRQRERLELIHRNALRLLKLVNSLLDFSRIESGRVNATYEPTDLAALTTDLVSLFRSAAQRAGLTLTVHAPALDEPVYVDRQMWEKIVLNLLSNALKFTFEGGIEVTLVTEGDQVELTVRDTGTGIPEDELPKLFERFHRVRGARSRSHEGSGIGLALVHDLVRLHGGEVTVESVEGKGSCFRVTLPRGSTHLPADKIGRGGDGHSTRELATPFVSEAMSWFDQDETTAPRLELGASDAPATHAESGPKARILLADDNGDLRTYVARLLASAFDVEAVADGAAALEAVRAHRPDLILSDVMMPRLDGLQLVRELRQDPATRDIPIILLSARAQEQETVTGLEAGADDYLAKPFSAGELMARVKGRLEITAMRKEIVEKEQALAMLRARDEFLTIASHELRTPLAALQLPLETVLRAARDDDGAELPAEWVSAKLEKSREQAQRLTRLIDYLLHVSRIIAGDLEFTIEAVDLAELVRDVIGPLREHRPNLVINFSTQGEATGQWDRAHLEHAVRNLVINAIKYGEGKPIDLAVTSSDDTVQLRVTDRGMGIAPEAQERIFERFERAVPTRKFSGFGLGLWATRKIVEALGGTLTLESVPGQGATFTIELPFSAQHQE